MLGEKQDLIKNINSEVELLVGGKIAEHLIVKLEECITELYGRVLRDLVGVRREHLKLELKYEKLAAVNEKLERLVDTIQENQDLEKSKNAKEDKLLSFLSKEFELEK